MVDLLGAGAGKLPHYIVMQQRPVTRVPKEAGCAPIENFRGQCCTNERENDSCRAGSLHRSKGCVRSDQL